VPAAPLRIANLAGRLVLLHDDGMIDVAEASNGRWGPDPMAPYRDWPTFLQWVQACSSDRMPYDERLLGPPVPDPRQVLAVGMNYRTRADEGGLTEVPTPPVFPKWPTCLTGPYADVVLPTATVDWEAELVVVLGLRAWRVAPDDAWRRVAGVMVGQDLSEREQQFRPPVAQFGLAKSYPGFGPTGPWLLATGGLDPGPLEIGCWVGDEPVQHGSTAQMLVPVAELISRLSANLPLLPGDMIFTGSPGGVGHHRRPPRYLRPGERLTTTIETLGTQRISLRDDPGQR
jgi:2-keto-4-pentenoate hydratase/2-oxohepta-3-ene-1,7-dioic acid hydratase in catechol pathway